MPRRLVIMRPRSFVLDHSGIARRVATAPDPRANSLSLRLRISKPSPLGERAFQRGRLCGKVVRSGQIRFVALCRQMEPTQAYSYLMHPYHTQIQFARAMVGSINVVFVPASLGCGVLSRCDARLVTLIQSDHVRRYPTLTRIRHAGCVI
jgi:hypothetical protein